MRLRSGVHFFVRNVHAARWPAGFASIRMRMKATSCVGMSGVSVAAGHAQAATLTCIGFFVIDRLQLEPHGSEASIAIVMMAGASATLAAQWGLIPRLALKPRALILSGATIAAIGLAGANGALRSSSGSEISSG